MRCVLLCMLEAVERGLCSLEVMRRVLRCMPEAVEGDLCLLEVMRCMLLRMRDAVPHRIHRFSWGQVRRTLVCTLQQLTTMGEQFATHRS